MNLICYRIQRDEQWKPFESKMKALAGRLADQSQLESESIFDNIIEILKNPDQAVFALMIDVDSAKLYGFVGISLDEWKGERAVMLNWLAVDRDIEGAEYAPCVFEFIHKYGHQWGCKYKTFKPVRTDIILRRNNPVSRKFAHHGMKPDITYWGVMPIEGEDNG